MFLIFCPRAYWHRQRMRLHIHKPSILKPLLQFRPGIGVVSSGPTALDSLLAVLLHRALLSDGAVDRSDHGFPVLEFHPAARFGAAAIATGVSAWLGGPASELIVTHTRTPVSSGPASLLRWWPDTWRGCSRMAGVRNPTRPRNHRS